MFSDDADTAVKEVEIEFLRYKFGGFWDFPKRPDKKIIEVKYVFYGHVLPASMTKSGFKIPEDDEAAQIHKEIKSKHRSKL